MGVGADDRSSSKSAVVIWRRRRFDALFHAFANVPIRGRVGERAIVASCALYASRSRVRSGFGNSQTVVSRRRGGVSTSVSRMMVTICVEGKHADLFM